MFLTKSYSLWCLEPKSLSQHLSGPPWKPCDSKSDGKLVKRPIKIGDAGEEGRFTPGEVLGRDVKWIVIVSQ
jgi:hypothetical protein